MNLRASIVIVGGGIIGCSIAYYLARKGAADVLLVEQQAIGGGTTGRSVGGIRLFKRDPLEAALSAAGYRLHRRLGEELGAPTGFTVMGSLALYADPAELEAAGRDAERVARTGVPLEVLRPRAIQQIAPYLCVTDLAGGVLCREDARADPYAVTQAYRAAAQRHGVRVLENTPVTGIVVANNRVAGVRIGEHTVAAAIVVNAAGAYAHAVGRMAGVVLPVIASKRQAFVLAAPEREAGPGPVVLEEADDLNLIPTAHGTAVIRGIPSAGNLETHVEWNQLEEVRTALQRRAPELARADVVAAWAGIRAFSKDRRPILGFAASLAGYFCAVGWGGVGFAQGPAVGMLGANMILGSPPDIDVSELSPARFQI